MTQSHLGRAAVVSLALGATTIGCTPSTRLDHVAALSDAAAQGRGAAAHAAAKAHAALDKHDADAAVRWAEQAVAASPNDADHRMLLGQAYLAAGRFASAEASLRDTLVLAPDQPRAGFDLALAEIAQGRSADALVTLAGVKGHVPDADYGLATALAGDRAGGIAVLTDMVRTDKSDARSRQNLALVFALNGQWNEARGMAMQDTPPDRLDAKLAGWAAMAKPNAGAQQVAAMLGVAPALADPGRPTALALAAPTQQAPVALALAAPAPAVVAPPLPAAAPVVALALEAPAVPPPVPPMLARVQTPPAIQEARVTPSSPLLVRVAARTPVHATVSPGPLLRASGTAGFVVQLGAFAKPGALDAAWSHAARLTPRFATFEAVRGSTQRLGGTLVRLSIGGFGARKEANRVCAAIKARGGACFVRGALGDQPWQWAKADAPTQIAMR